MIIRSGKAWRFVLFVVMVAVAVILVAYPWRAPAPPAAGKSATPAATAATKQPVAAPAADLASAAAGAAATESAASGSGFFATAYLDQQRAESRELALDQQVEADTGASASARSDAAAAALALGRRMEEEAEIRAVLLAKGYAGALVYLSGGGGKAPAAAVVVLEAPALTGADVARAADAVQRVAGVAPQEISVLARP